MSSAWMALPVFSLRPRRAVALRAALFALCLSAPGAERTLAYATPPDPSWIHGIYDDADFDDVVWLAVTTAGHPIPAVPVAVAPVTRAEPAPAPPVERVTPAPPRSGARPRAPPSFGSVSLH